MAGFLCELGAKRIEYYHWRRSLAHSQASQWLTVNPRVVGNFTACIRSRVNYLARQRNEKPGDKASVASMRYYELCLHWCVTARWCDNRRVKLSHFTGELGGKPTNTWLRHSFTHLSRKMHQCYLQHQLGSHEEAILCSLGPGITQKTRRLPLTTVRCRRKPYVGLNNSGFNVFGAPCLFPDHSRKS